MSFIPEKTNKLWWFGVFLVDLGLLLWLVSIIDQFLFPVLNILSANDLSLMGEIGLLAFKFALGFGSAATIGWGFAIMASATHYTKQVRLYLIIGMVVWYILDGISSFLSEFYLNIASNTLLIGFGIYVLYKTELIDE